MVDERRVRPRTGVVLAIGGAVVTLVLLALGLVQLALLAGKSADNRAELGRQSRCLELLLVSISSRQIPPEAYTLRCPTDIAETIITRAVEAAKVAAINQAKLDALVKAAPAGVVPSTAANPVRVVPGPAGSAGPRGATGAPAPSSRPSAVPSSPRPVATPSRPGPTPSASSVCVKTGLLPDLCVGSS